MGIDLYVPPCTHTRSINEPGPWGELGKYGEKNSSRCYAYKRGWVNPPLNDAIIKPQKETGASFFVTSEHSNGPRIKRSGMPIQA